MQTSERGDRTLAGTGFPLIKREQLPVDTTLQAEAAPSVIIGEELGAPAIPEAATPLDAHAPMNAHAAQMLQGDAVPTLREVNPASMTVQGPPAAVSLFPTTPEATALISKASDSQVDKSARETHQIATPGRSSIGIFLGATLATAAIAAVIYVAATRGHGSDVARLPVKPAVATAPVVTPQPTPIVTPLPAPVAAPEPAPVVAAPVAAAPPPAPVVASGANELSVKVGDGSCQMHVTSEPGESTVMIDGRAVGSTPLTVQGLYCGRSTRLVVSRDGYASFERRVSAEEGRVLQIAAPLHKPDAPVVIGSDPNGATIKIDGKVVGTTPAALFVSPNVSHTVELSMDGYRTMKTTVTARVDKRSTVNVEMIVANDPVIVQPFSE